MTNREKKELAFILFMGGAEQQEIAALVKVSENTVSNWAIAGEWKTQRNALRLTPEKLIVYYYEQSERIIEKAAAENRICSAAEIDSINKLASAIEKLDKRIDPSITMGVLMGFNNWLKTVNPELTTLLTKHQLEYVRSLM